MLDVRPEKQWLTAAEAAAEALPELPSSKSQVNRVITALGIRTRNRSARGGGREFHWSELPAAARTAYLKRHGIAFAERDERSSGEAAAQRHLEAEARAAIVTIARAFLTARNLPVGKGLKQFCAAYLKRRAGCEPWIYETVPALAPHRIVSWQRKLENANGKTAVLVDGRGRPKRPNTWIDQDAELKNFIIATVTAQPHLSAVAIREKIAQRAPHGLDRDVPLRTLQAFVVAYRPKRNALIKMMVDPDRGRSHHKAALGSRSQGIERLNQLWEMDATRGDCSASCPTAPASGPRSPWWWMSRRAAAWWWCRISRVAPQRARCSAVASSNGACRSA